MTPEQVEKAIAGILTAIAEMNRHISEINRYIEADRQARAEAVEADRQDREADRQAMVKALEAERQARAEAIEADRQARAEAHARHELEMAVIRQQTAETMAIANSNARAIIAYGERQDALYAKTQGQLLDLIRVVKYVVNDNDERFAEVDTRPTLTTNN